MNITIYTNETCPYCKQVKEELEKQDIKFLNRLTSEYPDDWNDIVSLTGMPTVPTIIRKSKDYVHMDHEENNRPIIKTFEIESIYIPGRDYSNPEHLINILKNKENSKYDDSRKTLEKVKTLNYNIGQAFQNLDKLLKQIETKLNIE